MITEKLNKLTKSGNEKACASWVASLNHNEKRSLTKLAIKNFKELDDGHWEYVLGKKGLFGSRKTLEKQVNTAKVAIFGLATLSEISKLGWKLRPSTTEFAEFIINSYQYDKDWVDEWMDKLFDINQISFLTAYELYQKGNCSRPSHDNYYIGLIWAFNHVKHSGLKNELLIRPDLLELEIWKLFELDGTSDCNLAGNEIYSNVGWTNALLELEAEGIISRSRLIKASLNALDRDFMQKRSGWFSRFHEGLKPTAQERIELEQRYTNLLGSQNPPTVSFALKALSQINKKNQLNASALLDHIEPVLYAKAKATVVNALKLLKSVVADQKSFKEQVALLATNCLCHESADVQQKAFDLIDEFGNKNSQELIEQISINADMLAPSQKPRLLDWCQVESDQKDTDFEMENTDDPFAAITRMQSVDELLESLSVFLEAPEQPEELERLLEAVVRIKTLRDEDFAKKTQAIAKRAKKITEMSERHTIKHYTALLILSFIQNKNAFGKDVLLHFKEDSYCSFREVLLEHIQHAVYLITLSEPVHLLASPTHGRGFIAPDTLFSRYLENKQQSIQMPINEQVLAILRLDKRIELTLNLSVKNIDDEFINAALYALGHEVEFGQNCALWIAASRVRDPNKKDESLIDRFKYRAPDAFEPAEYQIGFRLETSKEPSYTWCWLILNSSLKLPAPPNINYISTLFHQYLKEHTWDSGIYGTEDLVNRWVATIWPSNLTPYFGYALHVFSPDENSDWNWKCFFEPMIKSDVELTYVATMLLFTGLAARQTCQKSMAMEAAIQSIADGRLEMDLAAEAMRVLLPSQYITVNRWAKTFNEIASISKKHSDFIRHLIAKALRFDPEASPRNLGNLIELLYELQLAANEPVIEPCAVGFFKKNKKGGKQGKFSKKLLGLLSVDEQKKQSEGKR